MHRQTRSKAIPKSVKLRVWERDGGRCVLCSMTYHAEPTAHVIARSQGGKGIEQNIVTLCDRCHFRYDNTVERHALRERLETYLIGFYPDWNEYDMTYHKYDFEGGKRG